MAKKMFIRQRLNLTQRDLTRLTKIERSRIAHNERRKRNLPINVLMLLGKFDLLFQEKDRVEISDEEKKLREEIMRSERKKILELQELDLQDKLNRFTRSLQRMRVKYAETQNAYDDLCWLLENGTTLNKYELDWVAGQREHTRIKLKKLNVKEQIKMQIRVASAEAGLKSVKEMLADV